MRELLDSIRTWRAGGRKVAVATLVQVWGSAPRRPGARLALTDRGELAGSVSGGCVESAVVQEGAEVFGSGRPLTLSYGVSNEEAWAVGLTCGGSIELLVEELPADGVDPVWDRLLERVEQDDLTGLATVLSGDRTGRKMLVDPEGGRTGCLGAPEDDDTAAGSLAGRFPVPGAWHAGDLFLEVLAPRQRLVIFGGVHIAIPLVRLARDLGWHTTVVDPRSAFASRERFPEADAILNLWPAEAMERLSVGPGTAVAVLSHDPKIDVPAVREALASPAFYVGALGSRKTHRKRVAQLEAAGLPPEAIARVHAPIGLDLGKGEPEEIALAVLAQIVAVRRGMGTDPSCC